GAPDHQGTRFVVGFMENYYTNYYPELYITTSIATSVSVTVTSPKSSSPSVSQSFTIIRGQVQKITLNNAFRNTGSGKTTKGILIDANNEVIVYGYDKETYSSDGYLGIPTDVIGTSYYLCTYSPSTSNTQILIVGVTDSTSVTVRFGPNNGINVTYSGHNYYKNDQLTTTIHSYECLQIQDDEELTGTYVTANKAISVFSGNKLTRVTTTGSSYGDHMITQHVPSNRWGKKFVLVPTPTRSTGDYFRFIASEYDTTVNVWSKTGGQTTTDTFTLITGGTWVEKHYSSTKYSYIVADKPIYILMIMHSQKSGGANADPSMLFIPPRELWAEYYSFTTPDKYQGSYTNYFVFICNNADKSGMRLDGSAFSGGTTYNTIPNTDLVGGYISVSHGTHTVRHTDPTSIFGGYVVGLGSQESYAFTVGLRLAEPYAACTPSTQTVGDGIDNDCDGLIDEENCDTANNFADDDGDGKSEEDCVSPYPIDGVWTDWTMWGPCACISGSFHNGGTRKRTRTCTNPAPLYNGDECVGNTEETDNTCSPNGNCQVDGNWSVWTAWGSCTATCGTGTQTKTRTCTDPSANNGGAACSGDSSASQDCNTQGCPVDGAWTPWTSFSSCNYICGAGTSNRTRTCTNPTPAYGGATCLGDDYETQACTGLCMVDGNWNTWQSWGSCTVTCDTGFKNRNRQCTNPVPSNGGQDCPGDASEVTSCTNAACPTTATGAYVQLCPSGWFTCQSGGMSCIGDSMKCDCHPDCDDGSDETVTYAGCVNSTIVCSSAISYTSSYYMLPVMLTFLVILQFLFARL
ncbi:hypothetical protein FSP39_018901, partial [Pinctada imbricata]